MTRRLLVLLAVTVAVASSVAYAASLNVSSWHLWAGSQTLTKASCTVTGALVDTYVDQNNATTGFGTAATLGVIPSGDAPKQQWTFVEFDLSSCAIPTTGWFRRRRMVERPGRDAISSLLFRIWPT